MAKRAVTPLRAASEQRAADKKQILTVFEIVDGWMWAISQLGSFPVAHEEVRSIVCDMKRDMRRVKTDTLRYFSGQRARQKARKGGL
jgi:hypothetical protein